jgi:hypothetical protein
LIAGLLTALTIGAAAAFGGNALFSPGELNAVSGEASLGGIESHADLGQVRPMPHALLGRPHMGDRCLACHQQVAAELAVVSGFHYAGCGAANCRIATPSTQGAESLSPCKRSSTIITIAPALLCWPTHRPVQEVFRCMDCHPASLRVLSDSCEGCHSQLDQPSPCST